MDRLAIATVAGRVGLQPSTMRFYERIGVLPAPGRLNGRRRYSPEVFAQLAVIRLARQAGFTLAEARAVLHGFAARTPPAARWQALARRKLTEMDARIDQARRMKRILDALLRCEGPRLEDCVVPEGDAPRGGGASRRADRTTRAPRKEPPTRRGP